MLTKAEKAVLSKLGRKNGKRRLETMTDQQRSDAATHAANMRWKKVREAKEAAVKKPTSKEATS